MRKSQHVTETLAFLFFDIILMCKDVRPFEQCLQIKVVLHADFSSLFMCMLAISNPPTTFQRNSDLFFSLSLSWPIS